MAKLTTPPPLVPFAPGAPLPASGAFVALVDGATAPLLPLDLPPGLQGQARERVAERQISDAIGLPAGACELRPFTLGSPSKKAAQIWTRAIVSATDAVATWRSHFAPAGPRCRAILPDYLALPAAPDVWTLETTPDGPLRARLGLADGFTTPADLALALLTAAMETAPPKAILRLGPAHGVLDDHLASLKLPICTTPADLSKHDLPTPQILAHGELAFDLARNPRAAFEALAKTLRAWRMPVLLALLGVGLWSASIMVQTGTLVDRARDIRIQTVAEVREHFVPTGPVLDIRAQVAQTLAKQQAQLTDTGPDIAPLDLLKSATLVFADHPGRLVTASFQDQAGVSAGLTLPNFAALDTLVADLERNAIAVEIQTAGTSEDGGVSAILGLSSKEAAQ